MESTIGGTAAETPRPPVVGMAAAGLAIAGMAAVSWTVWPDLAEMVHGGRYNLDGSPNMVPRWLLAGAIPFTTALIAVILSAAPALSARIQDALDPPVRRTARSTTRAMNAVLVLLSLFMLAVHAIMVFNGAGRDIPTTKLAGAAVGVLLVGLALVVPLVETAGDRNSALSRWWADTRWPTAAGMAAVGVVQTAVALLVDNGLLVAMVPLLLLPAMVLGAVSPLLKRRRRD
ncbi:hypothetical protein [Nocardiopsis sp. NPDC057823]|uniref:hypothetical protein n=1 Tax=Nocardiopsis sp. NPDC057823 TaxID=3346256 RepID=UPI0036706FE9